MTGSRSRLWLLCGWDVGSGITATVPCGYQVFELRFLTKAIEDGLRLQIKRKDAALTIFCALTPRGQQPSNIALVYDGTSGTVSAIEFRVHALAIAG
jgi:hypothetical protein